METEDPLFALKNLIDAQQKVIVSWEHVFGSVESTIINLVKKNLELKLRLIKQVNPEMELPEDMFKQMDIVRERYLTGGISALEYFVFIDTMLSEVE
jgi:hypothetical protein